MDFHNIFTIIMSFLGFSAICTICGGILDSIDVNFLSFIAKLFLFAGSFTTVLVLLYFYNTYHYVYNEKRNQCLDECISNQAEYDRLNSEKESLKSDISSARDLIDKKSSRIDTLRHQISDLIDQLESW